MGFSASITTLILFFAMLIIATVVYPTLLNSYKIVVDSQDTKHDIRNNQLNTAIDITGLANLSENSIIATVSNKGTTVLNVMSTNILVDGVYKTYSTSSTGYWMPLTDAQFTVNTNTMTDHQIMIITEYGISDIEIFHS